MAVFSSISKYEKRVYSLDIYLFVTLLFFCYEAPETGRYLLSFPENKTNTNTIPECTVSILVSIQIVGYEIAKC